MMKVMILREIILETFLLQRRSRFLKIISWNTDDDFGDRSASRTTKIAHIKSRTPNRPPMRNSGLIENFYQTRGALLIKAFL